jgi:hypothetical protein
MVVGSEDEAIEYINRNEKPLALYVFSDNSKVQKKFIENTSSGSCVINETVMFMGIENLPFGGVGNSGMGSYNGRKSFEVFSHEKSVLNHSKNIFVRILEGTLKYGEMTKTKMFLLSELLSYRSYCIPSISGVFTFLFGLGSGIVMLLAKDRFVK